VNRAEQSAFQPHNQVDLGCGTAPAAARFGDGGTVQQPLADPCARRLRMETHVFAPRRATLARRLH
jgi:hypothetical protein